MSVFLIILTIVGYMGVATGLGAAWAGQIPLTQHRPYPSLYPDKWETRGSAERMQRRVFALLWPVIAPVIIASIINARQDQRDVIATKVDAALAKQREDMERSIADLERENGIGGQR